MEQAIGLIETKGLVAMIEAADQMLKSADVHFAKKAKIGGGYMTVIVTGEVSAVRAAVEAGVAAARKVGEVYAFHIIPRPDKKLETVF